MTVHGHIENGTIVLDDDVQLPEGARVTVEVDNDFDLEEFRKTLHPDLQPWLGILRRAAGEGERDLEDEYKQHLVDKHLR